MLELELKDEKEPVMRIEVRTFWQREGMYKETKVGQDVEELISVHHTSV